MKSVNVLWLMIFACGCESQPADHRVLRRDSAGVEIVHSAEPEVSDRPLFQISSQAFLRVGEFEGETPFSFSRIADVVRLSNGSMVVAAAGPDVSLRLFSADGSHIRTVGRAGEGPGEFQDLFRLIRYRGDSLIAYDRGSGRFGVYDLELSLAREFRLDAQTDPFSLLWPEMTLSDGGVLLGRHAWSPGSAVPGQEWEMTEVVRIDQSGEEVDTLGVFPLYELGMPEDGGRPVVVEFGARGQFVSGQNEFGWQRTDQTEVRFYRVDGGLSRIVRWTEQPIPLDGELWDGYVQSRLEMIPEDRVEQRERIEKSLRASPRGDFFYSTGLIPTDSEGQLWIQIPQKPGKEGPPRFRVFSASGEWLGNVELPTPIQIFDIGRDYLAGVVLDEWDVPYVVLHRIVRD